MVLLSIIKKTFLERAIVIFYYVFYISVGVRNVLWKRKFENILLRKPLFFANILIRLRPFLQSAFSARSTSKLITQFKCEKRI